MSQDGLVADIGGLICIAVLGLLVLIPVVAWAIRYVRQPGCRCPDIRYTPEETP